jgi:Zn-dependent protease
VALIELQYRKNYYNSITWNVLEYLSLFLIVMLHEFGHALACRSVGGQANQIVLWPLGGVAYVSPPQRPGAWLWSIAAGPLVNVVLVPILSVLWWLGDSAGWEQTNPNLALYIETVWYVNLVLLVFNMLPVYPLDGGKILFSLLWFVFGRARSLLIATVIGFMGVAGLMAFAIFICSSYPQNGVWLLIVCVFMLWRCIASFKLARQLLRIAKAPRRDGYSCPQCKAAPPMGDFWRCRKCRQKFDVFTSPVACPHCNGPYQRIGCLDCGSPSAPGDWLTGASVQPGPA